MTIFPTAIGAWLKLARADAFAQLDSTIMVPVLAALSVAVPPCQAVPRQLNKPRGDQPEPCICPDWDTAPDSVRYVFDVLADVGRTPAAESLDVELADLINDPNWQTINSRIGDAERRWGHERPEGIGDQLNQETMVEVFASLADGNRRRPRGGKQGPSGCGDALRASGDDRVATLTAIGIDPYANANNRLTAARVLGASSEGVSSMSLLDEIVSGASVDPLGRESAARALGQLEETEKANTPQNETATGHDAEANHCGPAASGRENE